MENTVDIFICGDIINQTTNKQFIDAALIDCIKKCDYSICNFEGTCNSSELMRGPMIQNPSTLSSLKEAGFNLLLLANNHVADYGYNGLMGTIEQIQKYGFQYMGAGFGYHEVYRPIILSINGLKIGIINLCEAQVGHFKDKNQRFGYAWIGDFYVDERIRTLRKDVDILIIIPHAGLENYSLPLLQFRQLYRHWCDLGADLVIGGHPHISQGIEKYGSSIIFYSLGNFFFSGFRENISTWTMGISCVLHLSKERLSFDIIQHMMNKDQVVLVKDDINSIRLKNEILRDNPRYLIELKKQNQIAFRAQPMRLYMSSLNGTSEDDSIILKFKKILSYLINRKALYADTEKYRLSVLKRLVENETYRFLTISAIEEQLA